MIFFWRINWNFEYHVIICYFLTDSVLKLVLFLNTLKTKITHISIGGLIQCCPEKATLMQNLSNKGFWVKDEWDVLL